MGNLSSEDPHYQGPEVLFLKASSFWVPLSLSSFSFSVWAVTGFRFIFLRMNPGGDSEFGDRCGLVCVIMGASFFSWVFMERCEDKNYSHESSLNLRK